VCPLVSAGDVTTGGFLAFVFPSSEESLLLFDDDSAVLAPLADFGGSNDILRFTGAVLL